VRVAAVGTPLLAQLHALVYAEAVLLVDDHEREAVELDALLEERVRAHGDLHRAGREVAGEPRAAADREPPGE